MTAETKEDRRHKKLAQVRALLDKAASTNFEEERDALQKKADELMTVYMIGEWELEFAKPAGQRERPELRTVEYGQTGDYFVDQELAKLFQYFVSHCNCKMGWYGWNEAKVVGYAADLDYLDMLFTSIRLHMALTMNPRADANLSIEENVVMLKETGMKWQRVYDLLIAAFPGHERLAKAYCPKDDQDPWHLHGRNCEAVTRPNGPPGEAAFYYQSIVPKSVGVWFTKVYTEYCKKHGRPRTYADPTVYRRSYVTGYVDRIYTRLIQMRRLRDVHTTGKELVLAGRDDDLLEFLYENFPEKRPHPKGCDCDLHHRCTDSKCQRPNCAAARKPVRGGYGRYVEPKMDAAARNAGATKANNADLSGRGSGVRGSDRKELE